MKRTYTVVDENLLRETISSSKTMSEVCLKLNKKPVGGNLSSLRLRCKRLNILMDHMLGSGWRKGIPSPRRKHSESWLIKGTPRDHRTKAKYLRRALIENKIPFCCVICKITDWQGKKLVLEIDHIDGQYWNNLKENLQFLCPNCHSQK